MGLDDRPVFMKRGSGGSQASDPSWRRLQRETDRDRTRDRSGHRVGRLALSARIDAWSATGSD
jgi:hypothetical protein